MTPSLARVTAAASASLTVGVMPVFLFGVFSDEIGDDLGFGSAGAGLAITAFFASGALSAVPLGRLTDRIGAANAMRLGITVSGLAALALGLIASTWWHLLPILGAAGMAIGLIDTGGARSFSDAIPAHRHGVAFGVKEASIPTASLLAGLSIPLLADAHGWEVVVAWSAVLAPAAATLIPTRTQAKRDRSEPRPVTPPRERMWNRALIITAVGIGLGAAASSAAATLFVPALTDGGWTRGSTGVLLAVASVVSISVRIITGWASDAAPRATPRMLVGALVLGGCGALVLTISTSAATVVVGAILLLGAGWGWTGLAFLSAVRASPDAPAAAAGIVLTGLAGGGALGPAAFGAIAGHWSYTAAWGAAASALAASAVIAAAGLGRHTLGLRGSTLGRRSSTLG